MAVDFKKIPPLKPLIGFEVAARLQSIRGAAQELNLTHPAVSHQLRVLEADLGVKLFEKSGRNIKLTQDGEHFYQYVVSALSTLQQGVQSLELRKQVPSVRLQAYVTLSIRWLAVRLSQFRKQFPEIDLQLQSNNAAWEFDDKQADIGVIYTTEKLAPDLHWIELFPSQVFPVCSPQLVSDQQLPLSPEMLLDYPLLMVSSEKHYWSWSQWYSDLHYQYPEKHHNQLLRQANTITVDTLAVALEMAVAGEGIALVNGPVAQDDIAAGKLIKPVTQMTAGAGQWGIVVPRYLLEHQHIQAVISWLQGQANSMDLSRTK